MSRSPDRIPRDRLFAYLREYETDNGFIPREHDIFRSLMYDFAKDRHIPAKPPTSGDEEVRLAVAYIYELIKECYDLPTRSFLFRVALFLEDRILITRGLEVPAGASLDIQPEYNKGDKAVLVISIAALMLTLIWLLTTAIPAVLQHMSE